MYELVMYEIEIGANSPCYFGSWRLSCLRSTLVDLVRTLMRFILVRRRPYKPCEPRPLHGQFCNMSPAHEIMVSWMRDLMLDVIHDTQSFTCDISAENARFLMLRIYL